MLPYFIIYRIPDILRDSTPLHLNVKALSEVRSDKTSLSERFSKCLLGAITISLSGEVYDTRDGKNFMLKEIMYKAK